MRTETCLQIEFNVVNFRPRAPETILPALQQWRRGCRCSGANIQASQNLACYDYCPSWHQWISHNDGIYLVSNISAY